MRDPHAVLFEAIDAGLQSEAEALAKALRAALGTELVSKLTPAQHSQIAAEIESSLRSSVWHCLKPFDNVGGCLTGEVLGFRISTRPVEGSPVAPRDIRIDDLTYADMWLSAYPQSIDEILRRRGARRDFRELLRQAKREGDEGT